MKMKLASTKNLSSLMSDVNYKKIWVYSEKNVDDFRIPIMDLEKDSSKSSDTYEDSPKMKTRKCFSLKTDSQNSEMIVENCLNENNFICYEKYLGNNVYKSSTTGRAFNTILIVTSFVLLQFL